MKRRLLILISLVISCSSFAQRFKLYSQIDGIPSTEIYSLCQDQQGFIWVATYGGLIRIDGLDSKIYKHNPNDTFSISSNIPNTLFEDSKKQLWVGSNISLQKYSGKSEQFITSSLQHNNIRYYPSIHKIKQDKQGNLWLASSHGLIKLNSKNSSTLFLNSKSARQTELKIDQINDLEINEDEIWCATEEKGIRIFNTTINEFVENALITGAKSPFRNNSIICFLKDRHGNLIIGTLNKGIYVYHPHKNRLRHFDLSSNESYTLTGGVLSMVEDKEGIVWIGTERNGLKVLDILNNQLRDANHLIDVDNILDSKITCYIDRDNNLWLGISHIGVYLMKANSKPFYILNKSNSGISNNSVNSILLDHHKNVWIGTDGGGLNRLSPDFSKVKVFNSNAKDKHSLSDNAIVTLLEDEDKQIWIGSYIGGLSLYNRTSGTFTNYLIDTSAYGRNNNFVSAIIQDTPGKLLVGTTGGGLYSLDKKTEEIKKIEAVNTSSGKGILPNYIASLLKDAEGNLWIGSYNGLFYWNREKDLLIEFSKANGKFKLGEAIYTVVEDSYGNVWAGSDGGLIQFNKKKELVNIFTIENGLCSNTIYGIEQDSRDNLWISTNNGLSRFEPRRKLFLNFYMQDGLPSNEFRPQSSHKSSVNELYFGTNNGLLYFNSEKIIVSNDVPKIILQNLKINNTSIEVAPDSKTNPILRSAIDHTESICLNYNQRNFSIDFTAINYTAPEKIKYAYMIEGFDESWNIVDYKQRRANYTHLNPGDYVFRIKSTNADGVWADNERSMSITIEPPFWKSNWAIVLYFLLFVLALYVFKRLILIRANFRNDLKVERFQRESMEKLNQTKLQFFTNVSHEFRTPLTLILGPIQDLIDGKGRGKEERDKLLTINNNANRLLRLADQLLDFRKVESGNLKLEVSKANIVKFIQEIKLSFDAMAANLKIDFSLTASSHVINAWFDPDQFEKIMFNLLSNAFKHTPERGKITVKVNAENENIIITVEDNGKGIKREHFENIFQIFFSYEEDKHHNGTGIGLALTKSLVDAHHGILEFESEEHSFTRFVVKLRSGSMHFAADEISPIAGDIESMDHYPSLVSDTPFNEIELEKAHFENDYPMLLIVEDNDEVRKYIGSIFKDSHNIREADNGKVGLMLALETIPDLIISDIMMPEMDGIAFCSQLKSNIKTSHIPIILLTARTSLIFKVEGLQTGADDYITKPFNPHLLKLKVRNLIHTREVLKKMFHDNKILTLEPSKVTMTSIDEVFLKQALESVEQNMGNLKYGVEGLCKDVGMSKSLLYKKLKGLTGQSGNEFIRTLRLKRAAQLLEQNQFTIAEVTNWVGFTDLQYFRDCFKKLFGVIPSDYVKAIAITVKDTKKENSDNE
ncbi:MAG: two-component regulator propeller domain-containing protein [Chryseolinea sp.]